MEVVKITIDFDYYDSYSDEYIIYAVEDSLDDVTVSDEYLVEAVEDPLVEEYENEINEITEDQTDQYVTYNIDQTTKDSISFSNLIDVPLRDGFVGNIQSILGTYEPRTETRTVIDSDGNTYTSINVVNGVNGVDWSYLSGLLIFTIMLYSLLRIVGSIFKR